jgi:hypothetical protein
MNIEQQVISQRGQRKRLEAVWWAGSLIWAGLVFGADSLGLLPHVGGADAWSWVFAGAGLYGSLGNLWRVASPDQPDPTTWDYVWSGILLILGLAGFINLEIAFPLILLLVGVVILGSVLLGRD